MLRKLKWQIPGEPLAARYNWCQGPVPGRGPAVEKHWCKATANIWQSLRCDAVNQQKEHIFIQVYCLYMFTQLRPLKPSGNNTYHLPFTDYQTREDEEPTIFWNAGKRLSIYTSVASKNRFLDITELRSVFTCFVRLKKNSDRYSTQR
jgi:hypothetical protein